MEAVGSQSALLLPLISASSAHSGGKNFHIVGAPVGTSVYQSIGAWNSRDGLRFNLTTLRHTASPARCAATEERQSYSSSSSPTVKQHQDYYELLGVEIDASAADIRKAYRQLQKKYHPDIAGLQGHAMTLMLNEAYSTLMDGVGRAVYDAAHSYKTVMRASGHTAFSGTPYSTWKGPDRPQGIFVDENSCVGCRQCVFMAKDTFAMDEALGSARVRTQWGDSEPRIKMAIESCPVNCIHYVEREDLPILEYLIRPQPRASNGVFGGGWDRPTNVFMAARAFQRRMQAKAQAVHQGSAVHGETPAQQKAREEADFKIRAGAFWRFWSWGATASKKEKSTKSTETNVFWKNIFGRASTSSLFSMPVGDEDVDKVIATVQDWALTFASSSELPLPMPFRADTLTNGVQLNLVTLDCGVLSSIGALVITVEQTPCVESAEPEGDAEVEYMLHARRQGVTGSKPLPGEGRILQLLKEALAGHASGYSSYTINRKN